MFIKFKSRSTPNHVLKMFPYDLFVLFLVISLHGNSNEAYSMLHNMTFHLTQNHLVSLLFFPSLPKFHSLIDVRSDWQRLSTKIDKHLWIVCGSLPICYTIFMKYWLSHLPQNKLYVVTSTVVYWPNYGSIYALNLPGNVSFQIFIL